MLPLGSIDDVTLNFNEDTVLILWGILAIIMFGIALDTKVDDFRRVTRRPRAMAVGIAAQFILLPAITFGLSLLLNLRPSIALGMILVACCPPGNISNILNYRARGNVALSVSMTAISNLIAIVVMPLNIAFWAGIHPEASTILKDIDLNAFKMLEDILVVIGIPFVLGITFAARHPDFATRAQVWVKRLSLFALLCFILITFASNFSSFKDYLVIVAVAVFLFDSIAFALGYGIASSFRLEEQDRRAVTFEVGVRNTAIGLGIVFSTFDGLGGMALIVGWWGIWDIIAGLALAGWWATRPGGREPVVTRAEA